MIIPRILKVLSTVAVGALVLSGCGSSGSQSGSGSPSSASEGRGGGKDGGRKEVSSLRPRVVIGYDGGLLTMDGATGKVLATTKHDGFLRLNPAGNGRHVLVSDGDRFRLFDTGLVSVPHEDHFHYYTQTPKLTGAEIKAPKAGHVVVPPSPMAGERPRSSSPTPSPTARSPPTRSRRSRPAHPTTESPSRSRTEAS